MGPGFPALPRKVLITKRYVWVAGPWTRNATAYDRVTKSLPGRWFRVVERL